MRLLWFADVLRAAGLTVVEVDGWEARGVAYSTTPLGVICHETQGSATSSVQGELNVLINGRTGLPGPIAQLMIDRKGVWYVVASGRCNQVKTGWAGPLEGKGNSYSFGVEAMHAVSEDWAKKPAQYASYVKGVAAICERMKWQPDGHVIGHKEHQPGDKSDPEFSMPAFRTAVAASLNEEEDMAFQPVDVQVILKTAAFPYGAPTQSLGTTWLSTYNGVNTLVAAAAADETRDKAMLAAIQALSAGGGVDAAPIVAAIREEGAKTTAAVAALQARVEELETERDDLNERLAAALAGTD